jgi:hypothetical protein
MKKFIYTSFAILSLFVLFTRPIFAQSASPGIIDYTNNTLKIITLISTALAVFFLIKGGYTYITSTGKPSALESAKKTIKNTLIGLVLVLSANVVVSVFNGALDSPSNPAGGNNVSVVSIEAVEPSDGLTQVLIDAVSGFIQNIVESSTEPIVNGVIGYLTTTPTLLDNTVVKNFWLVSVGIVDVLFVLVVALLGLQFMSASTFGFEEAELGQLLPRIGLAFLGANVSLFLADYLIITCNALVKSILDSTGGLNHAWIVDAINPATLITGTAPLIILIFMVLFLIVSIVLLLMYISRLIMIALGAVLAPFVFMMWALPRFSDFASISIKTYIVNIFVVFVHVVIIQLASSFLSLPDHNENSLISLAVAIGLFFTLLKTPSLMMQMVFYTSKSAALQKMSSHVVNVMSSDNASSVSRASASETAKLPRKVVAG